MAGFERALEIRHVRAEETGPTPQRALGYVEPAPGDERMLVDLT